MKQHHLFLTALMFYTRIPVPGRLVHSPEILNRSTGYLPLIGLLVGAAGGSVYLAAQLLLPVSVGVLLAMTTTILLTGAFHEDAVADFCDGFGGGHDRESILRIMKDSHIGTFGAVGLVLILMLRFTLLSNVDSDMFLVVFMAGNAYSRFQPILMIHSSEYMRKSDENKVAAIAGNRSYAMLIQGFILALIPLIFLPLLISGVLIVLEGLTFVLFRWYVQRKLGGYTGDVLGTLQQVSEIVFYLFFIIAIQLA